MLHVVGDMIEDASDGIIIQGCNAQGVMGSGLAKVIRNKWPNVYIDYSTFHKHQGLKLGQVVPSVINERLIVANCITQDRYGKGKRHLNYEALYVAMENVVRMFDAHNGLVRILHTPLIGADLAGGDWNIISQIIRSVMDGNEIDIVLWTLPGKILPNKV